MEPHDELKPVFHPDSINEQLDAMLRAQENQQDPDSVPGVPTIAALKSIYAENDTILERVWTNLAAIQTDQQVLGSKITTINSYQAKRESIMSETDFSNQPVYSLRPALMVNHAPKRRHTKLWGIIALVAVILIVLTNVFVLKSFLPGMHTASPGRNTTNPVIKPKPKAVAPLGTQLCSFTANPGVLALSWSSRGGIALEGNSDKITILDAGTCSRVANFPRPPFTSSHGFSDVSWSPDGNRLLVGDVVNNNILDGATGKPITSYTPKASVYNSSWSPNGKQVVSIVNPSDPQTGNKLQIWDATSGKVVRTLASSLNEEYGSAYIEWSPDGKYIAMGIAESSSYQDNAVYIWEVSSGRQVLHFYPLAQRGNLKINTSPSQGQERVVWSPDSHQLATYGQDLLQVWDIPTGKNMFGLFADLQQNSSSGLAWSPDGKYIAMAAYFNVRILDVSSRKFHYTYPIQKIDNQGPNAIAWSPDSSKIVTAADNVDPKTQRLSTHIRIWQA